MANIVQCLGLGVGLILLISSILLATDRDRRQTTGPRVWRVALVQHASIPVLDDGAAGVVEALAERGFRDGDTMRLSRYNAQGDIGTANTIAREVVSGSFDLVITVSTVSMQTVANANQHRRLNHVFGLVADPWSAGVGLEHGNPMHHPPYMIGQGIFLPVADAFRLARQLHPGLKAVGVVWNPAESNSEAFTRKARETCQSLGIELLEANADSSAAVLEAAQSLIGRGAEAIWIGGDVTVMAAIDSVLTAARKAGIPVFSITPGQPERGTFFDLGINFYECGRLAGLLAADILNGTDPATLPVHDVLELVPRRLVVNQQAFLGLKRSWRLPQEVLRQADVIVDEKGVIQKPSR